MELIWGAPLKKATFCYRVPLFHRLREGKGGEKGVKASKF